MTLQDVVSLAPVIGPIGQLLSGIAFVITAVMAVLTYHKYQKRQLETQLIGQDYKIQEQSMRLDEEWLVRFRDLYREFWKDDEVMMARYYINNEEGYRQLEPILVKRNAMTSCDVNWDEYKALERIDKFCAILARVRSFGKSISMTPVQEELWGDLLYNFWIKRIRDRKELRDYVGLHWDKLHDDVDVVRRPSHIRQLDMRK